MPILHIDGLHVLPTNIKDKRDIFVECLGPLEMCKCFYHSAIYTKCCADEIFSIAGNS